MDEFRYYYDNSLDPYIHMRFADPIKYTLNELLTIQEQSEINTGLRSLVGLSSLSDGYKFPMRSLEIDRHILINQYIAYARDLINLKKFMLDDLSVFWSILSRYFPFTEEEALECIKYINAKELEKNMFVHISDETMDMIKLYENTK